MVASVFEIKKKLEKKDKKELLDICTKLIKFKKENKELISFVLFESENLSNYVQRIKEETVLLFTGMNTSNVYFIKKTTRKILRNLNKYIRFAASTEVEVELLIYFCNCFKTYQIPVKKSKQLLNIYEAQIKKVEAALGKLHPDLQFDYRQTLVQ